MITGNQLIGIAYGFMFAGIAWAVICLSISGHYLRRMIPGDNGQRFDYYDRKTTQWLKRTGICFLFFAFALVLCLTVVVEKIMGVK